MCLHLWLYLSIRMCFRMGRACLLVFFFASRPLVHFILSPPLNRTLKRCLQPYQIMCSGMFCAVIAVGLYVVAQEKHLVTRSVVLMFARVIHAIGSSLIILGGTSLMRLLYERRERKRMNAFAMSGVSLGVLFGPLIGGIGVQYFGNSFPFIIVGAVVISLCSLLTFVSHVYCSLLDRSVLPDSARRQLRQREVSQQRATTAVSQDTINVHNGETQQVKSESSHNDVAQQQQQETTVTSESTTVQNMVSFGTNEDLSEGWVVLDKYVFSICFIIMIGNATVAMLEPLIPTYILDTFHVNPLQNALVWSVVPFAYLLATPFTQYLLMRQWRELVIISMAIACYGLTLPFSTKFVWNTELDEGVVGALPALIFSLFFVGWATGMLATPSTLFIREIFAWRRVSSLGAVYVFHDQSASIGSIIGPILGEASTIFLSYRSVILGMSILLMLFGAILSAFVLRHVPRIR
mmetsp:Transcript_5680/g.8818  ORF Transcript_5680/g.8818 Transcript_5680/m.8818 type:complete len:464 (-) Transcript_5680:153-1544(-)